MTRTSSVITAALQSFLVAVCLLTLLVPATASAYELTVADSMHRVRIDAPYTGPPRQPGALSGRSSEGSVRVMVRDTPSYDITHAGPRTASISAAGNETESFQILLMPHSSDLRGVRLEASPLQRSGGEPVVLDKLRFSRTGGAPASATLHARPAGAERFESFPLEFEDGATPGRAEIPARMTAEGAVEFYFEVGYEDGQTLFAPEEGAAEPERFTPDLHPPTRPASLKASEAHSYHVRLNWGEAADDGRIVAYELWRGDDGDTLTTTGKRLAELGAHERRFTDDAPPAERTVVYGVRAIDAVGRRGAMRTLRVDVPPNRPPSHIPRIFAYDGQVRGAADLAPVYATERWAQQFLSYRFDDITPGRYRVVLHFAETNPNFQAEGARPMTVRIGGEAVETGLDVYAESGANTALSRNYEVRIDDAPQQLEVRVEGEGAGPMLKGVEVYGETDAR